MTALTPEAPATPAATQQESASHATGAVREAARTAAALGYPIVALHGVRDDGSCTCRKGASCLAPGKHPRGRNWQHDLGTLQQFRLHTDGQAALNLGLRLDADAPVPLVLLDVDTKHGKPGAASFAQLEAECGALPEGALLQTTPSGGRHYLLRLPEGADPRALPNRADTLPGVDVFTHQRQFVLAPSRTALGAYTFVNGRGLVAPSDLPALPASWTERLLALGAAKGASSSANADADPAPDPKAVLQLLDVLPAPALNSRDECVAFAIALHGALATAEPELEAGATPAFLRWAGRWPGAVPERDEHIWESTRGAKHRGWRHVLADAQAFLDRARGAPDSEAAGLGDGADLDAAQALLDAARAEEAQRAFADVPVAPAVHAHAIPSGPEVSAGYRQAVRDTVAQARGEIPNPVDRVMHFDSIATRLGHRFGVHARAVSDSLRALDAEAARAGAYAPHVEWLGRDDRDRLASATPRYLVTDYLFADGAIHVVYGVPGSRKTFLALSWLLAVVANRPWGGRFPVQAGGGLFFAGEAAATLRVRRAAALEALGITPEMAASLPFGVVPELPLLGTAGGVDQVLRLVDTHYQARHPDSPLQVIVFDTLTRLSQRADASTTDTAEYGALLDRVDQIARATGASVVLIGHSPEGNENKPTGTYQTRGNADSVIKVERVDGVSSRLTVQKAKDDEEGAPLVLQFKRRDVRTWLAASYELEGRLLPAPLAEALAVRDFDPDPDRLPSDDELAADPVRATQDAALRRQFTSLVLTEALPDAPRANGRASREAQVEHHILDWLARHPCATARELRDSWRGRGTAVDQALLRLLDQERIENRGSHNRSAFYLVGPGGDDRATEQRAGQKTESSGPESRVRDARAAPARSSPDTGSHQHGRRGRKRSHKRARGRRAA